MRLYYFTTAAHGLSAIRDERLKISEINQLNDAFEFLGLALSSPESRKKMREIKNAISEEIGIICLSKKWNHVLMWSHYGEKHKGICLGFDVHCEYSPINYTNKRLTSISLGASNEQEITISQLRDSLFYKFSAWKYEKEYRLICRKYQISSENGLFFQPFGSDLDLKEVIVGCDSKITRADIHAALGDKIKQVEIFKVRPAFRSFKLVKNKNTSLWK